MTVMGSFIAGCGYEEVTRDGEQPPAHSLEGLCVLLEMAHGHDEHKLSVLAELLLLSVWYKAFYYSLDWLSLV